MVGGAVSGGLEVFVVEEYALPDRKGRGIFDDFQDAAVESDLGEVLHRIERGYGEQTPTGAQFLYRCAEVSLGQVLAQQPVTARERKLNLRAEPRTLFSTKGEGDVIAVTPTWRKNHQLDDWELLQGGFDTIATVSARGAPGPARSGPQLR